MKDYSSIIVSSRVRFMRNFSGFMFPSMIDEEDGVKVLNKVIDNALKINKNFKVYKIGSLSKLDLNVMKEKKLVTDKLIDAGNLGAVILTDDESFSIMINESDHIVEEFRTDGFNLYNTFEKLRRFDNELISKFDIAFDSALGYLTSDLRDVGTGMRASVTMFLPSLTMNGKTDEIISKAKNVGFSVEPEYDDFNTYYYTFSNIFTMGMRETEILENLTKLAVFFAESEIAGRKEMLTMPNLDKLRDMVYRDWGILTNCFMIDSIEAIKYLGELKVGIALDVIRLKDAGLIDNLMIDILPYSLTKITNSKISLSELSKFRAKYISSFLKENRIK